jgi:hypothetical protein
MKVSGPGSGLPPDGAPPAADVKERQGAAFAEKLDRPAGASPAEGPGAPPAAGRAELVGDIAADLRAGKLTAQAAVDKVVERILDRQLGLHAPAAVRERVGAALRDALETDPLLAEKVRALGG